MDIVFNQRFFVAGFIVLSVGWSYCFFVYGYIIRQKNYYYLVVMVLAEPKRKKGRPKKKIEIPEYNSNSELRDILIAWNLELVVNLKNECLKTGNIRKPQIKKAKLKEFEVTLQAIKLLNSILKDKSIDDLESKYDLLKDIMLGNTVYSDSDNKIFEMTPQLRAEVEEFENSLNSIKE